MEGAAGDDGAISDYNKCGSRLANDSIQCKPNSFNRFMASYVFTYNEIDGSAYLDGNLLNAFKLKGKSIQSCSGGDLRFGVQIKNVKNEKDSQYFKGAMDEIRIYNRALNGGEVKALFELKTT